MTSEIEKIRELLPMHVIGRLTREEAAQVEIALKKYPELSLELQEFEDVASAYREMERTADEPREGLFSDIMGRVRSEQKVKDPAGLERAQTGRMNGILRRVFASPMVAWGLAAAQLIVIVFLLAGGPYEKRYTTLTAPPAPQETGTRIRIAFVETATEGQIRALLSDNGASIIGGPTPEGGYTIQFRTGSDGTMEIETLSRNPLIRSVTKAEK